MKYHGYYWVRRRNCDWMPADLSPLGRGKWWLACTSFCDEVFSPCKGYVCRAGCKSYPETHYQVGPKIEPPEE
jgi:hypothetical protein